MGNSKITENVKVNSPSHATAMAWGSATGGPLAVATVKPRSVSPYLTKGHSTTKNPTLTNLFTSKNRTQVQYIAETQATFYTNGGIKRVKLYIPDKPMIKINPVYKLKKNYNVNKSYRGKGMHKEENIERSLRRSKKSVIDLALNNTFTHFATFTFSKNRHDDDYVFSKMQLWLRSMRYKYENFDYIIVPERHKTGELHFHALINGINEKEFNIAINNDKKSKYYNQPLQRVRKKTGEKYQVYNLHSFSKYGFTDVEKIESPDKVANYISKYITKELVTTFNKKRYWASKNLKKPLILDNVNILELPLEKMISKGSNDYGSFITYQLKTTPDFKNQNLTLQLDGTG